MLFEIKHKVFYLIILKNNKMKNILILIGFMTFMSCNNDDLEKNEPDYSSFLREETPSFKGEINSQSFNWVFGSDFQMSIGYDNGNGVCSPTDPVRILTFGLLAENLSSRFNFITPKMDVSDQNQTENIFSVGIKEFGEVYDNFYINVYVNNSYYVNKFPNTLEILKVTNFTDYQNIDHLKVWIKIENLTLENTNDENDQIMITNSYMIADFYGHKFE